MKVQRENRKRKVNRMTDDKSSVFISVWKEFNSSLRSVRKNSHVFSEMQCQLNEVGLELQVNEIRSRIYNFTKKYRHEKRKAGVSGLPSDWKYFNVFDEFLGSYKCNFSPELGEDSIGCQGEQSTDHQDQEDIDGVCLDADESQPGCNLDGFIVEGTIKEEEEFEYEDSNQESGFSSSTPHPTQHDLSPIVFNRPESDDNVNLAHITLPAKSGTSAKKRKKNSCESDYNMLLAIKESMEEVADCERERNEIEKERNDIIKEYTDNLTDSLVRMTDAQEELLGLIRISMSSRNST